MSAGGGDDTVLWWLTADTSEALLDRIDVLHRERDHGTSVVDSGGDAGRRLRLGIVDPTERKVRLARRLVRDGDPWTGRSDVWFSPDASRGATGRLAFLFPGVEPGFATATLALDDLASRVSLDAGLVPAPATDTLAHHSAAVFRLGLLLDRVLRRWGVEPDVIAGHSLGEWSGTVAAGIVTEGHADDMVDGLDLDGVSLPGVEFVALSAGADAVTRALAAPGADSSGDARGIDAPGVEGVVLSHDNSPHQSIICGPPAAAETALARLRAAGILGYRLDIQSGFHTPYVAPLLDSFRNHLDRLRLHAPRVPLWSATTVAPYPTDPAGIAELHLRHLVEPVRFRSLIERLYEEAGVRTFLQLGLGSLTGFVDDTLRGRDHVAVPVVTAKHTAFAKLQRALTALWVAGRDVHPEPRSVHQISSQEGTSSAPNGADRIGSGLSISHQSAASTAPNREDGRDAGTARAARLQMAVDTLTLAAHSSHDVLTALTTRLAPAPAGTPTPNTASPTPSPAEAAPLVTTAGATSALANPGTMLAEFAAAAPPPPVEPASAIPGTVPGSAATPPPSTRTGWPSERVVVRRRLSLETMPETLDHRLFTLPDGWPEPADGFPIVAMTTQLQLLQDVVEQHVGRPVVEIANVRNMRWLDLTDPQDVDITLTPKGPDTLAVGLGSYCRTDMRVASPADGGAPGTLGGPGQPDDPGRPGDRDDHGEPSRRGERDGRHPRHQPSPLANARPAQVTAAEMFSQRIMFHGPRFQGIATLGPVGDDGMAARFDNLATPGSLLDNLGKLIAYWVIEQRNRGESPLPIAVERIELLGPLPPVGEQLDCDIRIVELQDSMVRADGVIVRPDGSVWCRVHGWTSHIFHLDPVTEPLYHDTPHSFVAEAQAGDWNLTLERWPTGAGRDLTARRFLGRAELPAYEALNLLERRRRLIEIAAVKDTARRWLHDRFGIGSYPIELTVVPDGEHRYRVIGAVIPAGHDPRVTVATVPWAAATVVADGRYRDIEATLIEDDESPEDAATRVAQRLQARSPGAEVDTTTDVDVVPSTIEIVTAPRIAVAWTR